MAFIVKCKFKRLYYKNIGIDLIGLINKNYLYTSTGCFELIELSLKANVWVRCIPCTSYDLKSLLVIYVGYGHDISSCNSYGPWNTCNAKIRLEWSYKTIILFTHIYPMEHSMKWRKRMYKLKMNKKDSNNGYFLKSNNVRHLTRYLSEELRWYNSPKYTYRISFILVYMTTIIQQRCSKKE